MLPSLAVDNTGYFVRANTERGAQAFARFASRLPVAYCAHSAFCQLGGIVAFAAHESEFFRGIACVVGASSNEQMVGIDTSSNVASMAHKHADWDSATRENPSESVREVVTPCETNPSISVDGYVALPKPTRSCFGAHAPELLWRHPQTARILPSHRSFLSVSRGRALARRVPTFHIIH